MAKAKAPAEPAADPEREREVQFLCFALNEFGNGGPAATPATLQYFGEIYLLECMQRVFEDPRVSGEGHALARAYIAAHRKR